MTFHQVRRKPINLKSFASISSPADWAENTSATENTFK